MTVYSWHVTDTQKASEDLRAAVDGIMVIDDPGGTFLTDGEFVELRLWPAEAIELADWIKSRTEASRDNPWQRQFEFSTD